MPFQIALSGLNAASTDLSVTANNISNANTAGFKGSRAEFSDVFSVGAGGVGNGVQLASITQEFEQGGIDFTGNNLDLAISGDGFFTLSGNNGITYSRAGMFGVDREGYVVNAQNERLQVYPPAGPTNFNTGTLADLQLVTTESPPQATSLSQFGVNLPASAPVPTSPVFDPADPLSFNHSTSTTIYDSLGVSHNSTLYFVKDPALNTWQTHTYVDGNPVSGPDTVTFDATGQVSLPVSGKFTLPAYDPGNGADPLNITLDISQSTQFGGSFGVNSLNQDGFASGRMTGIDIDESGVVFARYTNGRSAALGQVALSNFANPQGLNQVGDSSWSQTFSSGDAIRGQAGTASFGLIQSGALESSNVDLTQQLVSMITAQRSFQANAQMISTADAVTQTIINIR